MIDPILEFESKFGSKSDPDNNGISKAISVMLNLNQNTVYGILVFIKNNHHSEYNGNMEWIQDIFIPIYFNQYSLFWKQFESELEAKMDSNTATTNDLAICWKGLLSPIFPSHPLILHLLITTTGYITMDLNYRLEYISNCSKIMQLYSNIPPSDPIYANCIKQNTKLMLIVIVSIIFLQKNESFNSSFYSSIKSFISTFPLPGPIYLALAGLESPESSEFALSSFKSNTISILNSLLQSSIPNIPDFSSLLASMTYSIINNFCYIFNLDLLSKSLMDSIYSLNSTVLSILDGNNMILVPNQPTDFKFNVSQSHLFQYTFQHLPSLIHPFLAFLPYIFEPLVVSLGIPDNMLFFDLNSTCYTTVPSSNSISILVSSSTSILLLISPFLLSNNPFNHSIYDYIYNLCTLENNALNLINTINHYIRNTSLVKAMQRDTMNNSNDKTNKSVSKLVCLLFPLDFNLLTIFYKCNKLLFMHSICKYSIHREIPTSHYSNALYTLHANINSICASSTPSSTIDLLLSSVLYVVMVYYNYNNCSNPAYIQAINTVLDVALLIDLANDYISSCGGSSSNSNNANCTLTGVSYACSILHLSNSTVSNVPNYPINIIIKIVNPLLYSNEINQYYSTRFDDLIDLYPHGIILTKRTVELLLSKIDAKGAGLDNLQTYKWLFNLYILLKHCNYYKISINAPEYAVMYMNMSAITMSDQQNSEYPMLLIDVQTRGLLELLNIGNNNIEFLCCEYVLNHGNNVEIEHIDAMINAISINGLNRLLGMMDITILNGVAIMDIILYRCISILLLKEQEQELDMNSVIGCIHLMINVQLYSKVTSEIVYRLIIIMEYYNTDIMNDLVEINKSRKSELIYLIITNIVIANSVEISKTTDDGSLWSKRLQLIFESSGQKKINDISQFDGIDSRIVCTFNSLIDLRDGVVRLDRLDSVEMDKLGTIEIKSIFTGIIEDRVKLDASMVRRIIEIIREDNELKSMMISYINKADMKGEVLVEYNELMNIKEQQFHEQQESVSTVPVKIQGIEKWTMEDVLA
eukprot:NODE_31_length_32452_cov_0.352672.p1 type:complete len:1038 gc:universal NODE_31_length_32452_cov_0.352672:2992-6105(+)